MPSISPLTTALLIVLVVAFAGAITAFVRDRARFRGYQPLTGEVLRLARALKGDVFRDGNDLVVFGSWGQFPVQVRFSHEENTPGLNIRMGAPAGFSLSVTSARSREVTGRATVRTSDESFNARFAVRSDHPTQARLFLGNRRVMNCLRTLCRSSETLLLITTGQIEFSELGVPDRQSAIRALHALDELGELAQQLRAMPGSHAINVELLRRRRAWPARIALAVGVVACVAALFMAARPGNLSALRGLVQSTPQGMPPADAAHVRGLDGWRLATADDLDPAALNWMRANHAAPLARIEGHFCAGASLNDVVYLMVNQDQLRRLVLLCDGEVRYDTKYPYIGVAQRVPRQLLDSIQWTAQPTEEPEADGLLITRTPDDPTSGLVLFTRGSRIITAVPQNYQDLKLE